MVVCPIAWRFVRLQHRLARAAGPADLAPATLCWLARQYDRDASSFVAEYWFDWAGIRNDRLNGELVCRIRAAQSWTSLHSASSHAEC